MSEAFISQMLLIVGYIIGLGAVTVIDLHGWMARKSSYWTVATIRTHKITKPLIWIGILLVVFFGARYFYLITLYSAMKLHLLISLLLIINGLFLSLYISPYLLKKEKEGKDTELLPKHLQKKITISVILSSIGWWGSFIHMMYNL